MRLGTISGRIPGSMQHTVYGTFREGRVELDETPTDIHEARVEVRFLEEHQDPTRGSRERALAAIEAVRQLGLTDEEARILDGLDDFRRANPFRLRQLVEDDEG